MIVRVAVVLEGQSAVADVIQVLEPLEVGHGDTASIEEEVRQDKDAFLLQNFISFDGCRSVGSLGNDLSVDLVRVLLRNDALDGTGSKNVALFVQHVFTSVGLSTGKSINCSLFLHNIK